MKRSQLRTRRGVALAAFALAVSLGFWAAPPQVYAQDSRSEVEPVVLFIVDLSGSMNEPFGDGRTKLDVAKAAFKVAFEGLDVPVGLRVYGDQLPSKTPADRQEGCETDTRLVRPISDAGHDELINQVAGFTARGDTPIALALQEAIHDIPEGSLATIVLFSDGRDECYDADLDGDPNVGPTWGPDPCDVARDIANRGIDLRIDKINTIGFRAGDAEAQLRCISEVTGGEHRNVETEEDVRGALVELGRSRTALRLGGAPIEGTPTADGAPRLERIATGESNRRYTDSVKLNDERWYLAPEYGPGEGHTTVTIFDLPKDEAINIELRMEPGPDENISAPLVQSGSVDPLSASDSARCGGCYIRDGDPHQLYWVVLVSTQDPGIIASHGEKSFDIELLLQEEAWGGSSSGCQEGDRCWYESQIESANQRLGQLEEQLERQSGRSEDLGQVQDEIAGLESELVSLQSQRESLEAGRIQSTNWLLPILLGALTLAGSAGWMLLVHRNPPFALATAHGSRGATDSAVTGAIDLSAGVQSDAHPAADPPTAADVRGDDLQAGRSAEPTPEAEPGREVQEDGLRVLEHSAGAIEHVASTEVPTEQVPEVPPGWYDDPDKPGKWRWWDGTAWTDHSLPKE